MTRKKKTDGVIHSQRPCFTRGLSAFLHKINKVKRVTESGVMQTQREVWGYYAVNDEGIIKVMRTGSENMIWC